VSYSRSANRAPGSRLRRARRSYQRSNDTPARSASTQHGVPKARQPFLTNACSASKISSILRLNVRASEKARGRLGSYLPVSIAFTVWRETPNRSARSACDQSSSARNTRSRFFTDT